MASNIESVRKWLRQCPLLDKNNAFRVDYINDDPTCYAIYSAPSSLSYKQDILGNIQYDKIQTLNFYFAVICPYGASITQNMSNMALLEELLAWIYEQNMKDNFPVIEEGNVISLLPTLTPFVQSATADSAVYRVSIQMKYRRK